MVSALDYVPQAEHAAILDGTSTYDATSAIQTAVNTGREVYLPGKRYNISAFAGPASIGRVGVQSCTPPVS